MRRTDMNNATRKKIQQYSYALADGIGKGYSSQVYKGKHDTTDETVAIKVIDVRMLKGQVHKNLLASQIDVLKGLRNSNNVIELFDVYNTKNNTYIVTQLCDGGDLSKIIHQKKIIPETDAIQYMKQIIIGYSNLYRHNIIHRDLKPANIFLKNGQIKIADFGFALKSVDGKKSCTYNVGSPIYMPPEALNQNKYSFKSDIWALGVIFYEMLTGKTPWKAKTQKQLGKMLTSVPIKKLLPKNISQQSIDFLMRTLQIDYQTRMCPQQLIRFVFTQGFNTSYSYGRKFERCGSQQKNQLRQTSLTRNSINTPKNAKRFNFVRGVDDCKNASLPKTAATIASGKQHPLSSNNITGLNSTQTYNAQNIDKKLISKQLLSQIHFCRFLYKLLKRIQDKINGNVSESLKDFMSNLIFQKLNQVKDLNQLDGKTARQYKLSQDYQKISQIISQYQVKYEKQITPGDQQIGSELTKLQTQLTNQILKMYSFIKSNDQVDQIKEEVIVLDYLVTLRQLISLLQNNGLQGFHNKSKMEAIVDGAPSKNITKEHVRAISAKLRAIKLL